MQNKKTTLSECILQSRRRDANKIAIKYKKNDEWQDLTWKKYFENCEAVGLGLKELGIREKDKVAIYSNTRHEWSTADLGIIGIQAVTVPIYQTVTLNDLEYILNNSEAKVVILENSSLLKNWNLIQSRCPLVEKIILIEGKQNSDCITWDQLLDLGAARKSRNEHEYTDDCKKAKSDDTVTIIYTSGTTGLPKGVELTHRQAISEASEAFPYAGATEEDITLSFLPYAHILGRVEHWGQLYIGYTIAFAESIEKVKLNLKEIRPTFLISVPRIFEKIYSGIYAQAEGNPVTSQLFHWAVGVGKKVSSYKLKKEPIPFSLLAEHILAKKIALSKVTQAFGGRLRFAISGGAPLSKDIALFFHACDILVLEGYGLTETTAAVCVNTYFDYRFGSVGKPIGDVQIKIADDGEILLKSDKVMKCYYKNPEATKESLSDGWFATGDIGVILPSGDLKITDRKKDLIKTAGGKYVAPQHLENLLKNHPFISHSLIHGDQKKYIVALITLDKATILQFAKEKNIQYEDYASLTQKPAILEMTRKAIAETNSHLASFETIKRFTILKSEFSIESGELTPSLKVKRKVLDKKYAKEIEALYS